MLYLILKKQHLRSHPREIGADAIECRTSGDTLSFYFGYNEHHQRVTIVLEAGNKTVGEGEDFADPRGVRRVRSVAKLPQRRGSDGGDGAIQEQV